MAMILIAAYLCLQAGFSSQKLIEARSEVAQNARVAMALMSADLRSACPLSADFDFLGMQRKIGEMEADNLDFATHHYTPRRPHEGDFCEMSYFVDKDPASGTFCLWRRRDPAPDPEPLSGGSREEIARGVRGLKLEYYDGWDWYDDWGDATGRKKEQTSLLYAGNLTGLPEAVRITLLLDPDPRAASEATTTEVKSEDEAAPPLVFQTVVRLNLATAAYNSSTGSSGESSGLTTTTSPGSASSGMR
jgi:hypothetical protein